MSEDKSHLQVIEKFSFISTLTSSRKKNIQQLAKQVSVDIQKFTDKPHHEPCHKIVHSSSADSVTLSSILGLPNITETNSSGLSLLEATTFDYSLDLNEQLGLSAAEKQSSSLIVRHLGKIIFAISASYFIGVAWWLAGHNYYGKIFPFSTLRTILNISEQKISAADLQFIDYMERSLANIEDKQAAKLNNSATKQDNSEVAYIPVYNLTNSTSETHSSQTTFPLNSSVNNSSLSLPLIPPPPPVKVPPSTFSSSSMGTSTSATPELSSSSPASSINQNTISSSTPSPTKDYTLIGIFELGNRSAALFQVGGMTKRIWVGEELDNKGWMLDSVANQKAKITRQGEVRSLSVGEKF